MIDLTNITLTAVEHDGHPNGFMRLSLDIRTSDLSSEKSEGTPLSLADMRPKIPQRRLPGTLNPEYDWTEPPLLEAAHKLLTALEHTELSHAEMVDGAVRCFICGGHLPDFPHLPKSEVGVDRGHNLPCELRAWLDHYDDELVKHKPDYMTATKVIESFQCREIFEFKDDRNSFCERRKGHEPPHAVLLADGRWSFDSKEPDGE